MYLIPSVIAEETQQVVIPAQVKDALQNITIFLAEDIRTARRYLSSLKIYPAIESLQFHTLDKNTRETELGDLMKPIQEGFNVGVLSESGCPGVADPGSLAVAYAHRNGIQVVPLVGPSSILLALMGSGLNGQQFAFHGYLPIDGKETAKAIKELERESRAKNQTQIFIETPYRNQSLFDALIHALSPTTRLSIAIDITGKNEWIQTRPIAEWKQQKPAFTKTPTVFLFLA